MNFSQKSVAVTVFFVFIIAALIGGTTWYAWHLGTQPTTISSLQPFSEQNQFVPKGTASQSVASGLQTLHASQSLPFFDEKNVVQSLGLGASALVSTTASTTSSPAPKAQPGTHTPPPPKNTSSSLLSYRIFGQSREAIQKAFVEYFQNTGWKMAATHEGQPLVFSSDTHQIVSITFLNGPTAQGTDQPAIIAALVIQ